MDVVWQEDLHPRDDRGRFAHKGSSTESSAGKSERGSIVDAIRNVLTPDLLKGKYKGSEVDGRSAGHCYIAAEAAFHMLGGSAKGWKPMMLNASQFPEGLEKGQTHWFIKNENGRIVDPTSDQYGGVNVPYDKAVGKGFLTKQPSKRAAEIIRRVEGGELSEDIKAERLAQAFVSPNVGNLTFEQARDGLNGQRQKLLIKASADIDGRLGLRGEHRDVIGAWTDGAENSLMISMAGVSRDEMLASAAMKGWLADQKSVLVFDPDKNGSHFMAKFAMAGKIDDIHRQLLEDGLAFHTLEPSKSGATVHVFGRSQEELDAVDTAAGKHGTKAEITTGSGEFVGTSLEEGDDRTQRDDARKVYERIISEIAARGKLRGRDVARVWQDVRTRWGGEFSQGEVAPKASAWDDVLAIQPMTAEEAHAGDYRRKAEIAADDVGFDKDKIVISDEVKTFKLGGKEYPYAGSADPDTGVVTVYDRVASLEAVPQIIAHEAMHQKYHAYLRDLEQETNTMQRELQLMPTGPTDPMIADGTLRFGWQNKYPMYQRHAEIERDLPWAEEQSKAAVFTEYSQEWWQAWRDGTAKTSEATGETLAEMAAFKMTGGSLSGPPPMTKGRQYWIRLYDAVEDNWRRRHAKQRMAA